MKVGVIGLGDIAQKAYLPVYGKMSGIEFGFYTRNGAKLKEIGEQYRFHSLHGTLESLIESGIEAAFVHSSTSSHPAIIRQLLENGIHVFVDKPIADNYRETKELVELAEKRGKILMAGFNRRYAPVNEKLKEVENPNMVIVQKHRHALPGEVRTFVFDDFIHVVDTLRFLFPYPIKEMNVSSRKEGGKLHHLAVQFVSNEGIAIGIMNRDSSAAEEIAEVMGPKEKRSAYNVSRLVISSVDRESEIRSSDWEDTLAKRGFIPMVMDFLRSVKSGVPGKIPAEEALETHRLCEEIIVKIQ